MRGSTEKRQKNLGNKSWKKKRRNLAGNYQGNLWLNYYMVGRGKGMREKEKKGGTKTGVDGKIPQDEES